MILDVREKKDKRLNLSHRFTCRATDRRDQSYKLGPRRTGRWPHLFVLGAAQDLRNANCHQCPLTAPHPYIFLLTSTLFKTILLRLSLWRPILKHENIFQSLSLCFSAPPYSTILIALFAPLTSSLVMTRAIYNNYPDQKSVIRSKMSEEFECLEVDKNSLCAKRCRHHALPRDP